MKPLLAFVFLTCLALTARASGPVTVCVIDDGQGNAAIVTTNPGGSILVTVHRVNSP